MKHCLPDMVLFNARLRPVVKTPDVAPSSKLRKAMSGKPGGFVRQAGSAEIAGSAGNESAGNGRIAGTDELTSRASLNDATTFSITRRLSPFSAFPAITALPAF
jgi:hypothetical protein